MRGQATEVAGASTDEKVAWLARVWRQADRDAIADKDSVTKQRAEYWARQLLRQAVDTAAPHP